MFPFRYNKQDDRLEKAAYCIKGVLCMKHTRMFLVACFAVLVGVIVAFPTAVLATNGMNMEGYGPIATGMGGASMAYDNGSAAMMNNPATLSLMPEGNRLDVAVGYLGPDINASIPMAGMSADSSATSFYMPALGWVAKSGKMSYGLGFRPEYGDRVRAFSSGCRTNMPVIQSERQQDTCPSLL
jgi:hypothetical protein